VQRLGIETVNLYRI